MLLCKLRAICYEVKREAKEGLMLILNWNTGMNGISPKKNVSMKLYCEDFTYSILVCTFAIELIISTSKRSSQIEQFDDTMLVGNIFMLKP